MKISFWSVIAAGMLLGACSSPNAEEESSAKDSDVRPTVAFEENGYLKQELVDPIRYEQSLMRATSAFEYALPIVGLEEWHKGFLEESAHGNWLIYEDYATKVPILTANTTTPYIISFINLAMEGPYYLDVPSGPTGGMILEIYQSPAADLGLVGQDQGQGATYLIVGPDDEVPSIHTADFVVRPSSNLVFIGTRIIGLEGAEYERVLKGHRLYPARNPEQVGTFQEASNNPSWMGDQAHGLEFWENLSNVLQHEPVVDRNRFILTQLRGLGIGKGEVFMPSEEQKEILIKAEELGNAMAMVNTFSREAVKEKHWPDRNWLYILNMEHLDHYAPNYWEVQEIAAYSYEAISTSTAMTQKIEGKGSQYLGSYRDDEGRWLDGRHTYEVLVPAGVPVSQFWSITVYDNDTRCIIQNEMGQADISSVMDGLRVEDSGDIKVYVGPKAPKGYESNWVQSNPEKGFFLYFRLYGPEAGYFDKSWKMPDVRRL